MKPFHHNGIVIALQYWKGDEARALKLARLLADLEEEPREDCLLLLFRSNDTAETDELRNTVAYCLNKFPCSAAQANRYGHGHPSGPNETWASLMEYLLVERGSGRLQFESVFTAEADGGPIAGDWIDRMIEEQKLTLRAGKAVTGAMVEFSDHPWPHINGNCIVLLPMIANNPGLLKTPHGHAWDMYHHAILTREARFSRVIENAYETKCWCDEQLKPMSRYIAWVHGVHDDSVFNYGQRLVKQMKTKRTAMVAGLLHKKGKKRPLKPIKLLVRKWTKKEQPARRALEDVLSLSVPYKVLSMEEVPKWFERGARAMFGPVTGVETLGAIAVAFNAINGGGFFDIRQNDAKEQPKPEPVVEVCDSNAADLFLRTYEGDYEWLPYLMRSLEKHARGWRALHLMWPYGQPAPMLNGQWPSLAFTSVVVHRCDVYQDDYIGQQISKLRAWEYSDAGVIGYLDSDTMFVSEFTPQTISLDSVDCRLWKDAGAAKVWRKPTEDLLRFKTEYETMCHHPFVYRRSIIKGCYEHVGGEQRLLGCGHSFSEFNLLGNYAIKFCGLTPKLVTEGQKDIVRQFWSKKGVNDPDVQAELERLGLKE